MKKTFFIVLLWLSVSGIAFAQSGPVVTPPTSAPAPSGLPGIPEPSKKLGQILADVSSFAIGLGITLASLMIVYAGYQMLTAAGNSEKFSSGMKTITYAVAGLAVMLLSAVIINILKAIIGVP